MRKKILVVTGTRAEYGLLRSTMDAIRVHPELELKLLVTGMHTLAAYGLTQEEIARDGYHIDEIVSIAAESDMLQALGQEIAGIHEYCRRERPDCIVVLGDRDEPFAAAIVAGHLNIPLAHIHGGDVTGPVVDESIRHSITKFAHLHFPGTERSAQRLRHLAEDPSRIFCVGTPVIDFLSQNILLLREEVAQKLHLDPARAWLLALMHPTAFDETPLPDQIGSLIESLSSFSQEEKIIVFPNSDTGSREFIDSITTLSGDRVHVFPSLSRDMFMSAVKESVALIGNSSAGIIEAAYLGTPSVNIGSRQQGRERPQSVIDVAYNTKEIVAAIHQCMEMKKRQRGSMFPSPYGAPGAGERIAGVLARELSRPDLLQKTFFEG